MSSTVRYFWLYFGVLWLGAGCVEPAGPATVATTTPPAAGVPARCSGSPVQMRVKPLSPYVYQQGDGYAYFDVWLQACPVPGATRQPLDISLVVDTSGSMGGQKIGHARAAAQYLLSVLTARDRLALVSYNTDITILFPLTAVTPQNRGWMSQRIAGLHATGMTNLGGGLDIGVRQLAAAQERQAIQRTILISDGLANVGVTSPVALNGMASSARQRGVSVTTMGVGLRFNELLLQSLAEYGGGRYHYIRDAQALLPIFRQEIAGVQATVATSVELTVAGCPGCRVVEAPGYALKRVGDHTRIVVSDLAGGQRRKTLIKVRLPRDRPGQRVVDVRLAYRSAQGARRVMRRSHRVAFMVTPNRRKVLATVDRAVADRVAHVRASKTVNKAMQAYQLGDATVAGNLLRGAASRLEAQYRATGSRRALKRARRLRKAARKVTRYRAPASAPALDTLKRMRFDAAEATRH